VNNKEIENKTMENFKTKVLVIIVLFLPEVLFGQPAGKIVFGEKHIIHSNIIAEDMEYWIHLPMNYDNSTDKYPVLYITDGDEHFFLASGITEFMSSQYVIPELIVVAVFHKDRNHDLTPTHCTTDNNGFQSNAIKVSGGGEKLLQFIEKELIAEIESNYRTGPYRILAGHSLGGLFSVYAYLNYNQLFNAFIAMDPALTWDNYLCERILKTSTYKSPNLHNKLYISSAHNAPYGKHDKSPFRLSQDSFFRLLKAKQNTNIKHDYFENQNHLTVPYQSLYAGLAYIYSGFYILDDPQFVLEIPFIQDFYKKESNSYGIEFTPPERLIEMFGKYFLFDKNDYNKSIAFFKLNTINYPSSYIAFEYLAKAYKASGNIEDAILNFKKALELNPENNIIQKLLIELENNNLTN
jgi:predicted alpha/beta superfamily hydrolase